jgi:hypothetical protein
MARVWYRAVRALLIRRRRPLGEPPSAPDSPPGVGLVNGTVGAGRLVLALAELGFTLEPVIQAAIEAALPPIELDAIDLGIRFDLVVVGSHLVNLPDDHARAAFLRLGARHVAAAGGTVLIEHHPLDWATTAGPTPATAGGSQPGMVDVRRDPPFVSAFSVFDVGGRVVRQPFTARVLSDEELAAAVAAAGLQVRKRLGPTWLEASPGAGI